MQQEPEEWKKPTTTNKPHTSSKLLLFSNPLLFPSNEIKLKQAINKL